MELHIHGFKKANDLKYVPSNVTQKHSMAIQNELNRVLYFGYALAEEVALDEQND